MRFLIDLQHPAHLHFFRNVTERLRNDGHEVLVTGRDKDILIELSCLYDFPVKTFGTARSGLVKLGAELLYRQARLLKIVSEYKPDAMMAIAGTFVSLVGRLTRTPTYVFYDTEHATMSNLLAYPFATCVFVPCAYMKNIPWRHERYAGYHELAYLHPDYFVPDENVLKEAGLKKDEPFAIVRFVGWGAGHDIGLKGLSRAQKIQSVKALSKIGRVLISAEGVLPEELEHQRLRLSVAKIHHLMAFARLVFGESGTMTSEAAVLGIPGVYINPLPLGYLKEQEQEYGLVSNHSPLDFDAALNRAMEMFSDGSREEWRNKGRRLVEQNIDVTDMLYKIALTRPYSV